MSNKSKKLLDEKLNQEAEKYIALNKDLTKEEFVEIKEAFDLFDAD